MARTGSGAKRSGATISDVADRAGVSPSTVSRVMTGNRKVGDKLSRKVREAADSLGYTASPLARSLVLGTTQTIAVVVPDMGSPSSQATLRGLSDAAAERGYQVLIADSHEQSDQERLLALQARRRCDGVVLCGSRMSDDDFTDLMPALAPVVMINRVPPSPVVPSVVTDYRSGLAGLLNHLHEFGHRDLLYLTGNREAASNRRRLEAIRAFEDEHPDAHVDTIPCGSGFSDGYAAADGVIESNATGVLAFNDLAAMGLLAALHERDVRVPEEISVTGFDDIPFARYTAPALTTASVSLEELGRQAWQRMQALLDGENAPVDLVFTPRIVTRGSTGPAPRSAQQRSTRPTNNMIADPEHSGALTIPAL